MCISKQLLYTLNYIVFIKKQKSFSHRFLTSRQPCVGVRVVGNKVDKRRRSRGWATRTGQKENKP